MNRVSLQTLGCKVNFAETSTIGRQFVERGFNIVDVDQPTDVFVLNTCSVTERADRECRQVIRRALRKSPNAYVVVVGCYAQLQPDEIATIDGVDLILGAKEKFNLFSFANNFQKRGIPQSFVSCIDEVEDFISSYSGDVDGRTRAFLKVQDGCDYTCAFCTIPLARGESRSQPITRLVNEARILVEKGFKEIVLTGVNVGDFGKRIGTTFFELVKSLDTVDGLERIRISSIEPNLLTPEIVEFILDSKRFCNHFHIPMQSGSDAILKRMRRRYLTQEYRSLIEFIKKIDSDAGIGADVLVGFPGETNDLFNETATFISDLPISYLHVFTYSERENTLATEFDDAVEPRIRHERNNILIIISQRKRNEFASSFVGKTLPVLFESEAQKGIATGLASNYLRVQVPTVKALENEIHEVEILSIEGEICNGAFTDSIKVESESEFVYDCTTI
ncbi:MAG: tRNA (N(6)-L-threonylcarbamoyladenosine(37)-C(2))-methylthiotransferase MtaB [Ignavibacteriales bacterium]|nr:tRNA (N(6)-L-threonylcarbamoyladenosine(37)-C(2))-methylthiotransferase MtaB [Ignavibacteriales bacterium]